MSESNTDAVVIKNLGGPSEVARICRVRPQAVSQWKRNGIPDARRDFLQLLRPEAFAPVAVSRAQEAATDAA